MRPIRPANKVFIPLLVVAIALISTRISQKDRPTAVDNPPPAAGKPEKSGRPARADEVNAGRRADFDFFLLALTSHPAFCADGHAREPECRTGGAIPISIHGLWPERLEPGRYPRDCPGPKLDLSGDTERLLAPLMPGMADGLHEHEWRKHGTCTGLDDDLYFQLAHQHAWNIDAALGPRLTTIAGEKTNAATLRADADRRQAGLGASLTFHCRTLRDAPSEHRGEPYLIEIRQCLDDDGADGLPGKPMSCARVNRRDQGCGKSFRIAAAR